MEKSTTSKSKSAATIAPAIEAATAVAAVGTTMAVQAWSMWFSVVSEVMKSPGLPGASSLDPGKVFGTGSNWSGDKEDLDILRPRAVPPTAKAKAAADTLSAEIERTTSEFKRASEKIAEAIKDDVTAAAKTASDIAKAGPLCAPVAPSSKKPRKTKKAAKRAPDNSNDKPTSKARANPAVSQTSAGPTKVSAKTQTDDLKQITGVGPKLEQMMNKMGVKSFEQIAAWGTKDIAKFDKKFALKGRIERDEWISQAKKLAGKDK